jgi:hypothetical protein
VNQLFGYQSKDGGSQSWLIVSDALSQAASIEYRDLVDIDPKTRSAMDEHKFEAELIAAGTYFPLRFELLIPEETENGVSEVKLVEAFTVALQGLEKGEIFLGAKKRRGWGQCCAKKWKVCFYDCATVKGLIGWLNNERDGFEEKDKPIEELLGVNVSTIDRRDICKIDVGFELASPMMIGSVSDNSNDPDAVHLSRRSAENGEPEFVVSGTGLAGVLRGQSGCILNTIGFGEKAASDFENNLWGFVEQNSENAWASRTVLKDSVLQNVFARVQSRVRINHFTGGAYPGALFSEAIVIPKEGDNFTLSLQVYNPKEAEIGLLMLAIKEMCVGDVSVGGGNGIGRGFLCGKKIKVTWDKKNLDVELFQKKDNQLNVSSEEQDSIGILERFVKALHQEVAQ